MCICQAISLLPIKSVVGMTKQQSIDYGIANVGRVSVISIGKWGLDCVAVPYLKVLNQEELC